MNKHDLYMVWGPNAVLETLTTQEMESYAAKRNQRWLYQMRQQYSVLMGETNYFAGGSAKSISAEEEYSMLLDPDGRINA